MIVHLWSVLRSYRKIWAVEDQQELHARTRAERHHRRHHASSRTGRRGFPEVLSSQRGLLKNNDNPISNPANEQLCKHDYIDFLLRRLQSRTTRPSTTPHTKSTYAKSRGLVIWTEDEKTTSWNNAVTAQDSWHLSFLLTEVGLRITARIAIACTVVHVVPLLHTDQCSTTKLNECCDAMDDGVDEEMSQHRCDSTRQCKKNTCRKSG